MCCREPSHMLQRSPFLQPLSLLVPQNALGCSGMGGHCSLPVSGGTHCAPQGSVTRHPCIPYPACLLPPALSVNIDSSPGPHLPSSHRFVEHISLPPSITPVEQGTRCSSLPALAESVSVLLKQPQNKWALNGQEGSSAPAPHDRFPAPRSAFYKEQTNCFAISGF